MPKGPLTVKIDAAMYDEIGLLRALVRDMSAFLDEWEWQLPGPPVDELQARARALGLSDTRDGVDIVRATTLATAAPILIDCANCDLLNPKAAQVTATGDQ